MGFGNPLFDGDEPLAPQDSRQRIVSMRLWPRPIGAAHASERAALPDLDEDPQSDDRGADHQHHQRPGERNQRG